MMWDWGNPPIPIRRIEVPNEQFMRGQPTNCYVLGTNDVVLVDPGSEPGIDVVPQQLAEFGSPRVRAIFLTHAHPDHSIAATKLRHILNAPVMLHPENAPIFRDHISWGDIDIEIDPEEPLVVGDVQYDLIMTPGHAPGHVALYQKESGVFIAGDLVSGNGTIGVFPPTGDMITYLDSLRRAQALRPSVLLPGHGPEMNDPDDVFSFYLQRRAEREQEILEMVTDGGASVPEILEVLYPEIPDQFSRSAIGTIYAHLLKLEHDGCVQRPPGDPLKGYWHIRERFDSGDPTR